MNQNGNLLELGYFIWQKIRLVELSYSTESIYNANCYFTKTF